MSVGNKQNKEKHVRVIREIGLTWGRDRDDKKVAVGTCVRGEQVEEGVGIESVQVGSGEEDVSKEGVGVVERVGVE